jgi:RecB family exonuclease
VVAARRAEDLGSARVLGVESHGAVQLVDAEGHLREVRFRADRVDQIDGALRITDYKTGNPPATQKKLDSRTDELRRRVASGTLLQASAYAFSEGSVPVQGRYLYLAPGASDEARSLAAPTSPEDRAVFEQVVRTLLAGLDAGCFLPRMRRAGEDLEPRGCTTCEVKDACLRGDSGARARLGSWAEAEPAGSPVEAAARALWSLDE